MIESSAGPGEEPGDNYVPGPSSDFGDAPAHLAMVGAAGAGDARGEHSSKGDGPSEDVSSEDLDDDGPEDGPMDVQDDVLEGSAPDEAPFAVLAPPLRRALEAR